MSETNVEVARRGYAAMNEMLRRGEVDMSLIAEYYTSDCTLKPSGLLPESAEAHGHEGIARFMRIQMDGFDGLQAEPLEFIDAGDKVVVPLVLGGKARYTGLDVSFPIVHVITVRDGKASRVDVFLEKADALEAVGLRE